MQPFASPDELREFAVETAALLSAEGQPEAGLMIESAANFVTSSGWEWLYELCAAVADVRDRFPISQSVADRLQRIQSATTSQQPYG